jgi:hypothetical protein
MFGRYLKLTIPLDGDYPFIGAYINSPNALLGGGIS